MKKIRPILIAFALSNMASLIYQISWSKEFTYVFGTSVYAVGTVLTCFMAGLAIGSFIFGERADKSDNPIRLLAYVEIGLGISALLLIPLFTFLPQPYEIIHELFEGGPFMNVALFAISFLAIIIPTSLIGGTFPIMNRIYAHRTNTIGKDVGIIYSIDTIFAALGALSAGFVLLPVIGISKTIVLAAIINIVAGVYLYTRYPDIEFRVHIQNVDNKIETNTNEKLSHTDLDTTERVVFLSFFLSGFAALVAQVVWTRFLALTLGTSVYSLSIITASFLIGLALGSYIISKKIHKIKHPITTFAFVELGIGASGISILFFIDKLDIPYLILYHTFNSFYPFTISLFTIILIIILIPTTLMGTTMPLVSKIISKKMTSVGTDIGIIFATNTFGAIFGSFFASFVLIPSIGMTKTAALGTAVSIFIAILLFANSERKWKKQFYSFATISIILCIYLTTITINPLFAGAYYHGTQMSNLDNWTNSKAAKELVHYEEGLYSSVSVVKQDEYIALRINGKSESSNIPLELVTEYQLAHIPIFATNDPKDVMMVGLGGGFTLDAITNHDEIETIDLVEINPHIIDVTKEYFSEYNNNALDDPRVNLMIDDARNHLSSNDKKYDVIISQPSNIWLSGEGGLFTQQMYEIAKDDLKKGGVFGQWMPLYEMHDHDFEIFLATFQSVFPYTNLWIVGSDAIIVGSSDPIEYDYKNVNNHILHSSKIRSDFEMMSDVLVTHGKYRLLDQMLIPYYMNEKQVTEYSGDTINTDDHPTLEFSTARNTIYYDNTENPFETISQFIYDKQGNLIITPPFTNLTTRYEDYVYMDFIDLKVGLDRSWTEIVSEINVDHSASDIYMEAIYTKDKSMFSILAIPIPNQPLSDDIKQNIMRGMQTTASDRILDAKEITVNEYWGYLVKTPSGNDHYNYAVSWFCDDNGMLYNIELLHATENDMQEIIESIHCHNDMI